MCLSTLYLQQCYWSKKVLFLLVIVYSLKCSEERGEKRAIFLETNIDVAFIDTNRLEQQQKKLG